jgi:UDP-2,3-diacylglucosamine pyrophosphatase LpxH
MRHHKPSVTDLHLQEEQRSHGQELNLLEPRPQSMFVMGGIFDVLEGKA